MGTTTNEATELAESVTRTSAALTELSESLKPLISRFTGDDTGNDRTTSADTLPAEAGGDSFDITEYTETARAVEAALEDAAAVLDRVEATTDAETLQARACVISGEIGTVVLFVSLGVIAVIAVACTGVVMVRRLSGSGRAGPGPRDAFWHDMAQHGPFRLDIPGPARKRSSK